MKAKWALLILVALGLMVAAAVACDDAKDLVDDFTEADENTPCGRYCIKCGSCKDVGDGYVKMAMDYTCAFEEGGKACELACSEGTEFIPGMDIEQNVKDIEAASGEKVTDLTCEQFALAVASGVTDGPCLRFCSKCVECSPVASGTEWCAKEGGLPCIEACEQSFKSYVEDLEGYAADNTDGIDTLDDVDCNDWEGTLSNSGLEQPEIPDL